MKIEMINENQIRCTLTSEDLKERKISIGELAYGSEKAKKLFSEMVQRATLEYGFQGGEGTPLMIEAVPGRNNNLVMTITRVDNPDELDPRFSRFTPDDFEEDNEEFKENTPLFSDKKLEKVESPRDMLLGDILKELRSIKADIDNGNEAPDNNHRMKTFTVNNPYRSFRFDNLDRTVAFAHAVSDEINVPRADLFKDKKENKYYLVIFLGNINSDSFNRICNTGCEFGTAIKGENYSYYVEYFTRITKGDALQKLGAMAY